MEDYDYDMEEMSIKAPIAERKAEKAKKEKRKKIRALKILVGIDTWANEDSIDATELADKVVSMVKFVKDPMVKTQFNTADFKKVHNGLVDIALILESMEDKKEAAILTKV